MTDRAMVSRWLAGYEAAWRARGTGQLAEIFTQDASYRLSPYAEPVVGLAAIGSMWEAERDGPDEVFTLPAEAMLNRAAGLDGDDWLARGSTGTPDGSADPDRQITVMNARIVPPGTVRIGDAAVKALAFRASRQRRGAPSASAVRRPGRPGRSGPG
jgi:hypothetical protein